MISSRYSLSEVSDRISLLTSSKITSRKPNLIALKRGSRLIYRLFGSWTDASTKNIPFTILISMEDANKFKVSIAFDPGLYLLKTEIFANKNKATLETIVNEIKSEFPTT